MTGHINPASLTERVAREVFRLGRATVDDMQQAFPDKTRKALHKALRNAVMRERIELIRRGEKMGKQRGTCCPGIYGPRDEWKPAKAPKPKPEPIARVPQIACVWDLGNPREICLPAIKGRKCEVLGAWTEE